MAEDLGMGSTQNSEDIGQKRISESHRPDIDWLRVFAVLLLIPFHAAVAFNPEPAAVILIQKQAAVTALIVLEHFLDHWQMQLLFVLAGWSTWFSLAQRTPNQVLAERRDRPLIPLIFGTCPDSHRYVCVRARSATKYCNDLGRLAWDVHTNPD